jgi:Zn-dependent protease
VPGRSDYTLFRFRGIPIGVDWSWFLVLFLIIWALSGYYDDLAGIPQGSFEAYGLAVVTALLFFGSILIHELGHAIVALRLGIPISHITLWLFGGIAGLERDSKTAGEEFKVAAAGPLATFFIVIACFALGFAAEGSTFVDAATLDRSVAIPSWIAVVAWIANINILLLLFNLLPAFPLDGGRITRAIVWRITNDREKATGFAAALGQGFGILMIGLGVFLFFQDDIIGGVWLGFIGFMLLQAARATAARNELTKRLGRVSVRDVMDSEPVAINSGTSVERALDEYFLRYGWPWFPVVDGASRFVGLLKRGTADAVPEIRRGECAVSELLDAERAEAQRVQDDEPLESLLGNSELRRLGALAAIDSEGRLSGVVTLDAVARALRASIET